MSMSILSMERSLASPSAVSFVAAVLKKACWVATLGPWQASGK
jgi:hypothetical protein